MEHIDHVPNPVIGKKYIVPCARRSTGSECVPIIGPAHDDAEYIGVKIVHYHRDLRFLKATELDCRGEVTWSDFGYLVGVEQVLEIIDRPMVCKRKMPDFPVNIGWQQHPVPWLEKLEEAYEHVKLKPGCLVCPHRLLPLSPGADGLAICSGHALCWDTNSGKLVRRIHGIRKRAERTTNSRPESTPSMSAIRASP